MGYLMVDVGGIALNVELELFRGDVFFVTALIAVGFQEDLMLADIKDVKNPSMVS